MTNALLAWSVRHPRTVVALAVAAAVAGELSRRSVSHDVIPDIAEPRIAVVARWMGHPAPEVASAVTEVVTGALADLPGGGAVRSSSMTGMAFLDVVLGPKADLDASRAIIVERLRALEMSARLPAEVRVEVGPAASSNGWIFQYLLDPLDPMGDRLPELRRFQEDVLRPALAAIPGVAEVATVGDGAERLVVEADTEKLRARAVAFSDVAEALRAAGASPPRAPASGEAARPVLLGASEIEALPVGPPDPGGGRTLVRDLATVKVGPDMMSGWADLGGLSATVGGIVVARRDADVGAITASARRILDGARARLPQDVRLVVVYDRAELMGRVHRTLFLALAQEIALVAALAALFLLHPASAVLPLVTLPLVLLLTTLGMRLLHVPATVMSLGGISIALGMAVDADLVALEAGHRALESLPPDASTTLGRRRRLLVAVRGVVPGTVTALLIAALTFLPVLAFGGETGRLLGPLAVTKVLVIVSAVVVAVTVGPVLRERLLRGRIRPELANPMSRALIRAYRPFVQFALERPVLTLVVAALAVASAAPLPFRLGSEFLPRIDEGDLLFMPTSAPGAPPEEAMKQLVRQDLALRARREVASVFGKLGRAETATDPAPLSMVETTVRLRPRAEWPRVARRRWYSRWGPAPLKRWLRVLWPDETPLTRAELVEAMDRATRLPGWTNAWTAPARARLDMTSTGARTPLALRIVSPDPERLRRLTAWARSVLERLSGVRSASTESANAELVLKFDADAQAVARFHVDPARVRSTLALLLAEGEIGKSAVHGRVVPVVLVSDAGRPRRAQALRDATVRSTAEPGGAGSSGPVPLGLLGRPSFVPTPAAVRSEDGRSVAYVYVDVLADADLLDVVARGRAALADATDPGVRLEAGERLEWAGQYQLMVSGRRRLAIVAPLVLLSMLVLLFLQFKSLSEAAIILMSVPFALVGSFWTLYLLHYPLSAPVWVGLLSTVGLAMQTGVVMVVYIDDAFKRRLRQGLIRDRADIVAAHAEGTVRRLRPKLMTIVTMAASLLPLLWADGAGAEIMKRVAAPMIGGLVTSGFLTLEVLPVVYTIWRHRQLVRARSLDV